MTTWNALIVRPKWPVVHCSMAFLIGAIQGSRPERAIAFGCLALALAGFGWPLKKVLGFGSRWQDFRWRLLWVALTALPAPLLTWGFGLKELGGFLGVLNLADGASSLIAAEVDWATPHLARPPGTRVRAIVEYFVSKRTMQSIVEPVLADVQREWLDAVAADRYVLAFAIRVRGYLSLAQNLGLSGLIRFAVELCGGPPKAR